MTPEPDTSGRDMITKVHMLRDRCPSSLNPLVSAALLFLIPFVAGGGGRVRGQATDPETLSALRARSIGPAGMSGRIAAIDAVEDDPNIIFVGAATGGLWKSVNGGQTWDPTFDQERVLGIGAVAVFQANPEIVWVGTGEGNPRNSAGVGAGIYKSLDGGLTWELLGLERSERIHRILLHPTDPDIAYAGVMGPAWSDGEERGVYRTADGGTTWERVLYVDRKTGIADLVMDPSNPDKLLAAMWEFRRWPWFFESGGPGSGLYMSYDGGDSWTRLSEEDGLPGGELGRIGLAIARNDPSVVYALVEAAQSALLRSDDGGTHWRVVAEGWEVVNRPFHYADIVVDPENELRIYNLSSRLMLSEDGGRTFREIAQGVHPDFHALWIDPGDARLAYVGTDGGVYVSRDRGSHWGMIDNLPVGQFYHVSVDMDIPFNVYGGMQDNGSWRGPSDVWENGGIRNYRWKEVGFGDGFGTLLDPSDPSVGFSMSQGGGLVRFDLRTGERKGIRPWAPDTVRLRFNWNAAIAIDPLDPGTVYFGSQFVHRTRNRGDTWELVSPDLTTNDPEKQRQDQSGGITRDATGAENHTSIVSIAPSPVEKELIWVGTDDGRVHLTRSGGGYWEDVGRRIRGVPEGTWVPHIEASKNHGGTAYVVFDDHRRGNWTPYIYRTENYGRDWRNIADADQIWGFAHTIEEDPVTSNLLFAGTEFGLYVSLNRGEDWFLWTHGLPAVPIRSLAIHPRDHDLVIGTHGRAIYILDDIRPLRAVAQDPSLLGLPVHLFDTPPAFLRSVTAGDGYHFAADALFQGEPRPFGALLTYAVGRGEEGDSADIEILDSTGEVVRRMRGPGRKGMNRVAWDLREDAPGSGVPGGMDPGPGISEIEVLPGRYTVRVTVADGNSETALEVLPDPRVEIAMADRIRKREAIHLGMELMLTGQVVQERSREIAQAVERVMGEVGARDDEGGEALVAAAREIRQGLDDVADLLRQMNRNRGDVLSMSATRDAPTEAERIALDRMEEALEEALIGINGLMVTRLADFRVMVEAAGLERLPEFRVVIREGRR
jgi:photosystem II stability/assembly factor-like uncharacterized protein